MRFFGYTLGDESVPMPPPTPELMADMGTFMEERLGLHALPIPHELPPMPIYMIWHETRRHDTAHNWLREVVLQELGRLPQG